MTVTCNDPVHEARRRAGLPAEPEYAITLMQRATPCLICGAPIQNGEGHDPGCMGLDG